MRVLTSPLTSPSAFEVPMCRELDARKICRGSKPSFWRGMKVWRVWGLLRFSMHRPPLHGGSSGLEPATLSYEFMTIIARLPRTPWNFEFQSSDENDIGDGIPLSKPS
ncbi:hypothetical protein TNCV_1788471 [Trichonephila clavipes]|nr:hypothetical protein TNCV_1788471 [Trichonephila clavipes]